MFASEALLTAAERRGRDLLYTVLSRRQRTQFDETQSFLVQFPSGNAAEVSTRSHPVVIFLQKSRGLFFRAAPRGVLYHACVHLEDNSNRYDRMVAVKLALEVNGEKWFCSHFRHNLFYCGRRFHEFPDRFGGTYHLIRYLQERGFRLD